MPTIHLDSQVGGGWVADIVQILPTSSSIVLVEIKRGNDHKFVRLDLDKGMYIDALPQGLAAGSSASLAQAIALQLYGVAKRASTRP
jgi:hypothetical protein